MLKKLQQHTQCYLEYVVKGIGLGTGFALIQHLFDTRVAILFF